MSVLQTQELDFELLARYSVPGPRYTSYPTALLFHEKFTAGDYLAELDRLDAQKNPLSLYVHLPFCESVCYYCGCNVTYTKDHTRGHPYLESIYREMDLLGPHLSPDREVVQLHWGGGTPTFFSPVELGHLFGEMKKRFRFAADAELGIEVDPRKTVPEHLQVLGAEGFNRISVGIQDFDERVQKAIHRVQSVAQTRVIIEAARSNGFESVSVDLMYGLPLQSVTSFSATLDEVLDLNPDRLALFNFAYLPQQISHQKAIHEQDLPPAREKLAIFRLAVERLLEAGYRYIGMDHFAKPEDELCRAQAERRLQRNFQGYSTRAGCDLLAFGASSISSLGRVYAQNLKETCDYESTVQAGKLPVWRGLCLTDEDVLRREVIMRLMCDFELRFEELQQRHGIDFTTHFAAALEALRPMERDGLLEIGAEAIRITPTGRFLIRNVCMSFDAYLDGAGRGRYSKTV